MDFGGRVRAALRFQNPDDPEKLDNISEIVEADLYILKSNSSLWLNLAAVLDAERASKISLPNDYRALLTLTDGLRLRRGRWFEAGASMK